MESRPDPVKRGLQGERKVAPSWCVSSVMRRLDWVQEPNATHQGRGAIHRAQFQRTRMLLNLKHKLSLKTGRDESRPYRRHPKA
jgi:hypothetical protein